VGGLQTGGEPLIANHLDESLWLANQKQGAEIRLCLLHSSLAGAQKTAFAALFLQASAKTDQIYAGDRSN
jgi:hypothetical protein